MISTLADLLIHLITQQAVNCRRKEIREIWVRNSQMVANTRKQLPDIQPLSLVIEQNESLKQTVRIHSELIGKLTRQFTELKKQLNSQDQQQSDSLVDEYLSNPETQKTFKGLKIDANLEDIRADQNFQEEFMSKFNEFSLSWRKEAMQLKKI